ncbi:MULTISPECIES: hypothetical protein [Flavobacterium]|uniref:Uncharacterized protein n=1 Tax=Flavobacterium jumunjinense TaxID=998845 RepID=A0ABV5GQ14_9FLAO|nr:MULTISPECIES: hypothetical protein [Flavobacterium]
MFLNSIDRLKKYKKQIELTLCLLDISPVLLPCEIEVLKEISHKNIEVINNAIAREIEVIDVQVLKPM